MAKRQALPINERPEQAESLAEYTYSKFASAYFESNSRPEFERRLLKRTLLSSTIISVFAYYKYMYITLRTKMESRVRVQYE